MPTPPGCDGEASCLLHIPQVPVSPLLLSFPPEAMLTGSGVAEDKVIGFILLIPSPCTAGVVSSLLPPGSMLLRSAPPATVVSSLLPCGEDVDGDGLMPCLLNRAVSLNRVLATVVSSLLPVAKLVKKMAMCQACSVGLCALTSWHTFLRFLGLR